LGFGIWDLGFWVLGFGFAPAHALPDGHEGGDSPPQHIHGGGVAAKGVACYVLRVTCYVLRVTYYVLRVMRNIAFTRHL